jgi:hypothetical protein
MRWVVVLAVALLGPCSRRAPPDGGGGAADAAPRAAPLVSSPAAARPASSGPSEVERQRLARAKKTLATIESLVARGSLSDPARPGEDASLACASFAEQRPDLEKIADPEVATVVATTSRLCAFDVPLLAASDSLDQLARPRSQSSTLLFCKSAQREIAQARSVDPKDARVRALERRWAGRCRDR